MGVSKPASTYISLPKLHTHYYMAPKFGSLIRRSYDASLTSSYIQRLCSSWLLPPTLLFVLRATISLYIFIVRFTVLGIESTNNIPHDAERDTSYFTDLTYWGLGFYFAFTAAHTASYAFRGRAFLESWPGPLRWLHSKLYVTITVYPWIVTAVYWAILADGAFRSRFSTWSNISQHALNAVFAFLEIVLPRSEPHPWLQLLPLIVIAALYLGLAYLSHATQDFYVYSFLNPSNGQGLVAGACIGILVGMIVVFVIVRYLIWLRQWVTEKKLGMTGKLSKRSTVSAMRDEEEMADISRSAIRTDERK